MGEASSVVRQILGVQDPVEKVGYDNCPVGIILCDRDGVIYSTNKRTLEIFGSPYPLVGTSIHEFAGTEGHEDLVRGFVDNPLRKGRSMAKGKIVHGKTVQGDEVSVRLYLGHAMFDGIKMAIGVMIPVEDTDGS